MASHVLASTRFTYTESVRFLEGEAFWGCQYWQISRLFVKTQRCDLRRCTALPRCYPSLLRCTCNADYSPSLYHLCAVLRPVAVLLSGGTASAIANSITTT